MPFTLLVAILAGLAGGLMALAGFHAGMSALLLLFAAPIAIYIATLGWGPVAGVVATAGAAATLLTGASFEAALVCTALLFAPAAWGGHLANLAQQGDRGVEWYPLGRLLAWMMVTVLAGFVIAGFALGYDSAQIAALFVEFFKEIAKNSPDTAPPAEAIENTARMYASIIPFIMPMIWLMLHMLVFHMAAMVTRLSGNLPRAPEDIAATITLPKQMLALPAAGFGIMMIAGSPLYDIGAAAAGISVAGFGLCGLASLHHALRGRPSRGALLFLTYLTIVVFTLPLFVLAIMGAMRSVRAGNGAPPSSST